VNARPQKGFQDGAIAVIDDRFAIRQADGWRARAAESARVSCRRISAAVAGRYL